MANPTIAHYFGATSQVVTSETTVQATAANPALVIQYADLASEGLTSAASMNDPDKVFAALVKRIRTWIQTDGTEEPGTSIDVPTKNFTTRNNQQLIAWLYYVSFFTPDMTAASPDPDDVV